MSFPLPSALKLAIEDFATGLSRADIAQRAAAISQAYRGGHASQRAISSAPDVAAYLLARLPATYAATSAALSAVRELMPDFQPSSLLDLCAGPGTASFASLGLWPSLSGLTLVDANRLFLDTARHLGRDSGLGALAEAKLVHGRLAEAQHLLPQADLVLMSYALVELQEREIAAAARRLWSLADGLLVFVEPGTPEGFRRIILCRDALIEAGARLVAPCPHAMACPIVAPQWCHFGERLPRSRDHRLVKEASLPFEDEPYAYLAFSRRPLEIRPIARIISRVRVSKVEASCRICAEDGHLADHVAPRRDRDVYASLRRATWGDALFAETPER
ncbi:Ribosomal protein RSM22 (predicted rRNA methylase) [Rhizobiales bacterium GAS191]|nr:Ribosomal protein RSM22 (predicted rRNA methylase) [Rhizobiales bacterium GAS191]